MIHISGSHQVHLCADCKWRESSGPTDDAHSFACTNPGMRSWDSESLVTGEGVPFLPTCLSLRESGELTCGGYSPEDPTLIPRSQPEGSMDEGVIPLADDGKLRLDETFKAVHQGTLRGLRLGHVRLMDDGDPGGEKVDG